MEKDQNINRKKNCDNARVKGEIRKTILSSFSDAAIEVFRTVDMHRLETCARCGEINGTQEIYKFLLCLDFRRATEVA